MALLVGYVDEPEVFDFPVFESVAEEQGNDCIEIRPEDVPMGTSVEDIEKRRQIILKFYHNWKLHDPSQKRFNLSLKEHINIRFGSITETCAHASINYFSTLAVLQLDAILANARLVSTVKNDYHEV